MRLSDAGRRLIKGFEGLRLTAYPDGKLPDGTQLYSVGYGHNGVARGTTISEAEADRLFDLDVARFERCVSDTTPEATQAQFDAMVSLTYNIGTSPTKGFPSSTVARLHNIGDFAGAADAFRMWTKSAGKVLPVLVDRREVERTYYLRGAGGAGGAVPSSSRSSPSSPAAPSSTSSPAVDSFGRIDFGDVAPAPRAGAVFPVALAASVLAFFLPS